jgi:HD-GYP domain-containing protein (c-di-GMP phosphodiesterase class II)
MKDMCGTKFDPRLFSVFLTVSEKFKKAYAEP